MKFDDSISKIKLTFNSDDIKALLDYNPDRTNKDKDECKFIDIDFYLKDLNDLWNFLDYKYTFFDSNMTFEKIKNEFNLNITEEEFLFKEKIYNYVLLLDKGRNNLFS